MGLNEEISEGLDSSKSKNRKLSKSTCSKVTDRKDVEQSVKRLDVVRKPARKNSSMEKWAEELKEKEAKLEVDREELTALEALALARLMEVDEREKVLMEKDGNFILMKEALELKNKELEAKNNDLEIRVKELEVREKNICPSNVVAFKVELDGVDVLLSYNGRKVDTSSELELSNALRLSGAPVLLVLEAVQVLYPPYLNQTEMRFEGNAGRSCISMLEQLLVISPQIVPEERDCALKLAFEWKDAMSVGNSLEVLGFLYLLAAFDLASAFDAKELMELFEIVAEYDQLPELRQRLDLKDVSKSCKYQDQRKAVGDWRILSCSGSDSNIAAQGQVEVPSTIAPNFSTADPKLLNTDVASRPMALIIANMDAKNLLSFLEADCQLLQNEVSIALRISGNSAKLVLEVIEVFYRSFPQEQGSRSCVLLLEQLMRSSPVFLNDVMETAQRIALDWKLWIRAELKYIMGSLVFLLFISAFGLVSAFDGNELLQLYKIVLEHKFSGISEGIYGLVCSRLQIQQIEAADEQLEAKPTTSATLPKSDVESSPTNVNMESDGHVSGACRIPRFIKHSSDSAKLVLDAIDFSIFSNSQKRIIPVMKSLYYLLKQLNRFSPEIRAGVKEKATKLASAWNSMLTGSNYWEILAFMLFQGAYGMSSSLRDKNNHIRLLVKVPPLLIKEAGYLIRLLSLKNHVPGLIRSLIEKKRHLLAIEYVYEFKLLHVFPPVQLLEQHVLDLKSAANMTDAEDSTICKEISSLNNALKCIEDHRLESEYLPDELKERVKELEALRENKKPSSMTAEILELLAPQKALSGLEDGSRKRAAPDSATDCEPQPPPSKKLAGNNRSSSKAPVADDATNCETQPPPSKKSAGKNRSSSKAPEADDATDCKAQPPPSKKSAGKNRSSSKALEADDATDCEPQPPPSKKSAGKHLSSSTAPEADDATDCETQPPPSKKSAGKNLSFSKAFEGDDATDCETQLPPSKKSASKHLSSSKVLEAVDATDCETQPPPSKKSTGKNLSSSKALEADDAAAMLRKRKLSWFSPNR